MGPNPLTYLVSELRCSLQAGMEQTEQYKLYLYRISAAINSLRNINVRPENGLLLSDGHEVYAQALWREEALYKSCSTQVTLSGSSL